MSKEKKEEKKEEKSPELVAAEKKAAGNKEMAECLQGLLEKHNCSIEGQMELYDGKMHHGVVFKPCLTMGEQEEDAKKRAEKAKAEVELKLKELGHKLDIFAVLDSSGTRFGFKFVEIEEEKK